MAGSDLDSGRLVKAHPMAGSPVLRDRHGPTTTTADRRSCHTVVVACAHDPYNVMANSIDAGSEEACVRWQRRPVTSRRTY